MQRKFIIRDSTPTEPPPTTFWLEKHGDDITLMCNNGGGYSAQVLAITPSGGIRPGKVGTSTGPQLGLKVDERGKVVVE